MKKKIIIGITSVFLVIGIIIAIVFGPKLMLAYRFFNAVSEDGDYKVTFGLEKVSKDDNSIADFIEEYIMDCTGEINGTKSGDTFDGECFLTGEQLPICQFRNETGEVEFKVGTTFDYVLDKTGLDNDFMKGLLASNYDKYVTLSELESLLGQESQPGDNTSLDLGISLSISALQDLKECEQPSDTKILSDDNSFSFYKLEDNDLILGIDDEDRLYGSILKDGYQVEFIYKCE